jgi:hypothetical protein
VRASEHKSGLETELVKVLGAGSPKIGAERFTSPAFLGNAMSAALEAAGIPLSIDQRAAIAALGRRYAEDDAVRLRDYDERTFALRKLVEEAELKQRFLSAALELLTPEQRNLVSPISLRDRLFGDLVSTGALWMAHSVDLAYADARGFAASVADDVARRADLPDDVRAALRVAVDRWTTGLPPAWFDAGSDGVLLHGKPRISVTAEVARQELEFLESLPATLGLSSSELERLRTIDVVWRLVPRSRR